MREGRRGQMVRLAIGTIVAGILLAVASAASGQSNPTEDVFAPRTGLDPTTNPYASVGTFTVVGGGTRRAGGVPGGSTTRSPKAARTPRNGVRCTRIGNTRTCTTYHRSRAIRVCVKVSGRPVRCRASRRGQGSSRANSNVAEGWYAGDAPMGRLWLSSQDLFGTTSVQGICSGTVVGRNIVLTAAHCAYSSESGQFFQNTGTLFFDPGNGFAQNGGATAVENSWAPYGSWNVADSYVPQCYVDTASLACDVGLLVIAPSSRGQIGDVVGSYPVAANVAGVTVGTEVRNAGYPAGGGFESYANGMGNAPYYCSNRLTAGSGLPGGFDGTDSGAFLQTFECPMTGGASGGPVYVQLNDGRWYIWGVNNHADYRRLGTPFSRLTGTQPFGDVFLGLWRQITGTT